MTPIIVLKPQMAGLDTNLLITTDRRAYYLRLISKPQEYVARATVKVYDTATGQFLLIPQGSRLVGKYDCRVTSVNPA
jgi:hypothetical protein